MVASGHTKVIAEKEESCVVFGMPKSVIKAGLAHETRHVDDIAHAIISSMKKRGREHVGCKPILRYLFR